MKKKDRLRWSVLKRLEFIEFRLLFTGKFNRSDLCDALGMSPTQVTSDVALYNGIAPSNMSYDSRSRTYRRAAGFEPVLVGGLIGEYLSQAAAIGAGRLALESTWFDAVPPIEEVALPRPRVDPHVLLAMLDAIREGREVDILRGDASDQPTRADVIAPHALFHSASRGRWYARCWSRGRDAFVDQDLAVVGSVAVRDSSEVSRSLDLEWWHEVELVLVPNPALTPPKRRIVVTQYGMVDDRLVLPCRLSVSSHIIRDHRLDVDPDLLGPEQPIVLLNRSEVDLTRAATRQMTEEALALARTLGPSATLP